MSDEIAPEEEGRIKKVEAVEERCGRGMCVAKKVRRRGKRAQHERRKQGRETANKRWKKKNREAQRDGRIKSIDERHSKNHDEKGKGTL